MLAPKHLCCSLDKLSQKMPITRLEIQVWFLDVCNFYRCRLQISLIFISRQGLCASTETSGLLPSSPVTMKKKAKRIFGMWVIMPLPNSDPGEFVW